MPSKKQLTVRCRRCGQMYEPDGMPSGVCPSCQMEREEQFLVVRELVREHPGITAIEVQEISEVPMDVILKYINHGLLEVVPNKNDDGEISERVGIMLRRAKEKKKVYEEQKKKTPKPPDEFELKQEEKKQKLTWHDS